MILSSGFDKIAPLIVAKGANTFTVFAQRHTQFAPSTDGPLAKSEHFTLPQNTKEQIPRQEETERMPGLFGSRFSQMRDP